MPKATVYWSGAIADIFQKAVTRHNSHDRLAEYFASRRVIQEGDVAGCATQ